MYKYQFYIFAFFIFTGHATSETVLPAKVLITDTGSVVPSVPDPLPDLTQPLISVLSGVITPSSNLTQDQVGSCSQRIVKRIVGGQPTAPHQFPEMVVVESFARKVGSADLSLLLCGGTVLNCNYVLTAAHCVLGTGFAAPLFSRVTVGKYKLSETEPNQKTYNISTAIIHPKYNPNTNENDVALLRTNEIITYNEHVKPTCLPLRNKSYTGIDAMTMGWGLTEEDGETSDVLRAVDVKVISNAECSAAYEGQAGIYDSMVCAGDENGGKDSCNGDSGGPLSNKSESRPEQFGIVSFGIGCGRKEYPGVYAYIPSVLDFIFGNSRVECGPQIYSYDSL